jgi:hypothetical protein
VLEYIAAYLQFNGFAYCCFPVAKIFSAISFVSNTLFGSFNEAYEPASRGKSNILKNEGSVKNTPRCSLNSFTLFHYHQVSATDHFGLQKSGLPVLFGEKLFSILRALEKGHLSHKKYLLHLHDDIRLTPDRCDLSLSENYRSWFEIV